MPGIHKRPGRGGPPNRRGWQLSPAASAVAPVAYALTCDVGAYVYAGQAATLTCERQLPLATGAYSYAGVAATLTVARQMALATGTYSYAGQAATLTVARQMALAAGAYSYAGLAATLTYTPGTGATAYALTLDAGAYAYAGLSADLIYVNNAPPIVVVVAQTPVAFWPDTFVYTGVRRKRLMQRALLLG